MMRGATCFVLGMLVLLSGAVGAGQERTNFVVVLADDLGYGDLGCYGNPVVQTPHLDRFSGQGWKLTACYSAAPNCSPSRAGLMTGRTPFRVGIHNWIPMFSPMHLKRDEITVARLLRDAGYATCQVGKWHLNGQFNRPEQPQPDDHGFQYWFATQNNALPNHQNPDNFVRNGEPVGPLEGYSAHLVVDEAILWLNEVRDRERPFFLYVCFHEPHEPIETDAKYESLYDYPDQPSRVRHHGNITQMDAAFGRLMAALDKQGLSDSTLVFFTSDNGPAITNRHPYGSAGPLREKKGHLYDGGIRVPGLIRWPGQTQPGVVIDEPVSGVDLLPTLCQIAGIEAPMDRRLDGTSLMPLFQQQPLKRTVPLYWQFNASASEPKVAIREGRWKILARLQGEPIRPGGDILEAEQHQLKTAELGPVAIYDLQSDIGEQHDLAETSEPPDALRTRLEQMYLEVRDASPTWPAWEWPRYEAQRIKWAE